jgi:hypothetical protein
MARARFCSECGEQLKVKRVTSLPCRSFCSHCSTRFKRARMILLAAPALCAVIGFVVGHYTASPEPFYYIGTPVESSRSVPSPDDNAAHSIRARDSVTQREQLVSSSAAERICAARTKSGKPCQRKVKGGGYCWQHREKLTEKNSTRSTQ